MRLIPLGCLLDTYANLTSGMMGKDSLVLIDSAVTVRLDLLLITLTAIGKGGEGAI